jgi:YVTN family beta-propeller protein
MPRAGLVALGVAIEIAIAATATTPAHAARPVITRRAAADARAVPVGTEVIFTVGVTDPDGDPISYVWEFGDGSPSVTTAGGRAVHVYRKAGHHVVLVRIQAGSDRTTDTFIQTAHWPLPARPPSFASSIVYDSAADRVWTVNPDAGTVTCVDARSLTKIAEGKVGRNPRTLALAPGGRLVVANQDDATLSVIDRATAELRATITLPHGSRPFGVAVDEGRGKLYVTLEALGQVARLDLSLAARAPIETREVAPRPRGLALSADGRRLYVSRFLSPPGRGEITELDAASFAPLRPIVLPPSEGEDNPVHSRGVPNYLGALVPSPDGRRMWAPGKKDNLFRGLYRDRRALTFESMVRAHVSIIELDTGMENADVRIDVNNNDFVSAVAFSPLGDYAFVALQGNDRVQVRDAYTAQRIVDIDGVGGAPQGLVISPDGGRLFVQNFLSRDISAWDVSGIVDSTDPVAIELARVRTVAVEPLAPQILAGKRLFYGAGDARMNSDGYVSCASCHLEGDHDGRVWDFTDRGEGLRNTISLLGRRGTGHGRVHWSANFDEIQDFERDIREHFEGRGFLDDDQWRSHRDPFGARKAGLSADLDALAAFVASLDRVMPSPFRRADGGLTSDGVAGRQIFRDAGCPTCHPGPDFTDSALGVLHDVGTVVPSSGARLGGTLPGIDTPTLKGAWATAPYLHDGRAASLRDIFTEHNQRDRLGRTSNLSPREIDQLVEYVRQIDDRETGAELAGAPRADERAGSLIGGCSAVGRGCPTRAVVVPLLTCLGALLLRRARPFRR